MSTADSQLLVTASSVSKDIYKDILKPESDEKKVLKVSRFTVLVVALLAFLIAWDPNNSIMGLVSNAWAGLGSAFGPIVVMSLFWSSGDCVRWRCGSDMGLSAAGTWTDAWNCDRAVFTGGRICAEYSMHCDLQPLYEETISGNSGRVR